MQLEQYIRRRFTPPWIAGINVGGSLGRRTIGASGVLGENYGARNTSMTVGHVDDSDPVMTLDALTYTVTITNTGTSALSGLSVAFTIDANSTYVGSSAGGFDSVSQSGGVVTATQASGPVGGGTSSFTVTVTTPAVAITLTASISATASNASTVTASETTVVQLVAKDVTSGKRCPANAAQWTSVRACRGVIGTPYAIWLMQEAAGNLADSGPSGFTLSQANSPLYQQVVSGWSRLGVRNPTDGAGNFFFTTSASCPDLTSASSALLLYAIPTASPTFERIFMALLGNGGTGQMDMRTEVAGTPRTVNNTNAIDGVTSFVGVVQPPVIRFNRTATTNVGFTLDDKMAPTFGSITGKGIIVGGGAAAVATYLYGAAFRDGDAEFSNVQLKATEQALGWSPTWIP